MMQNDNTCFLCGTNLYSLPRNIDSYYEVECINCGKYKISDSAIEKIVSEKDTRYSVAGDVFESCYYLNEIKTVNSDDFAECKRISTIEKLFKLSKYFYTEIERWDNNSDIRQRPSCCYQKNDANYSRLMKKLNSMNVIDYCLAEDDGDDYTSHFVGVHLTDDALFEFEKGINSEQEFESAFMGSANSTHNINIVGNNNQINASFDNSKIVPTLQNDYNNEKKC
jgi:hypothetical protein